MKAVIYARYSSHAQNDASIEQQVEECRQYAASHDLQIMAVYADRAMTGRSDRRPEFQKMMRAAEKQEFQAVLAYKSNRISRSMLHALQYEEKLSKHGISIIYCKEEFGNNAAGRFALRTMMNMNQFYSENMAEDIQRGLRDNAQQCRVNGAIPLGYKRSADGKYIVDEMAAPIVREIFQRVANGEPKAWIADDLNARGIRTQRGSLWNKNSFHSILTNERYTGIYIYQDIRIPGGIPAIIPADLFADAQRAAAPSGRKRTDNMDYILTGKLYCGHCRQLMHGTHGTGKSGQKYHYYMCSNNDKKPVRKDMIEPLVLEALQACVLTDENIDWMINLVMQYKDELTVSSTLPYLESRLTEIKTALRNLMRALEAGIITETTQARIKELETEQKEVLAEILREKRSIPDITPDHVRFFFEQFRTGNINDKKFQKTLIQNFLQAVYLYDDHFDLYFTYTDATSSPTTIPVTFPTSDDVRLRTNLSHQIQLNRTLAHLYMIGHVFVLRVILFQDV